MVCYEFGAKGTSWSSILGEATINLADYDDASSACYFSSTCWMRSWNHFACEQHKFLCVRDKGLQSGNNVDKETEPNTARSSSSELEMLDDREMNMKITTLMMSIVSRKVYASQSPPTEKMHKDVAIDFEDNHRLRGSLGAAELSITELKMELSLLQSHASEIASEMKSSSQFMERNIEKSDHVKKVKWVDGVLLVEDQIRNLQEKVYAGSHEPDLRVLKSDLEVLFNTVHDLKKETVKPESMLPSSELPSPPHEKLLSELDVTKSENENLVKKMNEMESYYEGLTQELEENQKGSWESFKPLEASTRLAKLKLSV
ncbi:hypothetical protein Tco_0866805 [Tanacetum coccineum]